MFQPQEVYGDNTISSKDDTIPQIIAAPESSYETLVAKLTSEEQRWYHKFQHGFLVFDGWQHISEELISIFPNEKKSEIVLFLDKLGTRIGTEWCRDNSVRRIDTDHLQKWGDKLKESKKKGTDAVISTLGEISDAVTLLLSEKRSN